MAIEVVDIYRYPVKGLSPEALDSVDVQPGEGLPHDRRFALAHGTSKFDPKQPEWLPKTNFFMLLRDEKLAQLRVRFDPESGTLAILRDGKQVVQGKATEPLGRTLISQFFASFLAAQSRGTPRLVEAPGHMFSDVPVKCLSIINLASVRDLERVMRVPIDPLRFRANLYIEGLKAWEELEWPDKTLTLGKVQLKGLDSIERCAATNVDPVTAARDLNIPLALQRGFSHVLMGAYATVTAPGRIAKGMTITVGD